MNTTDLNLNEKGPLSASICWLQEKSLEKTNEGEAILPISTNTKEKNKNIKMTINTATAPKENTFAIMPKKSG